MTLTKQQRKILEFLKEFTERRGYAPSLAEIGRHFGLRSPATVHKHMRNLEARGAIRRRWNQSRALEVLPEPGTTAAMLLPLSGELSADEPPRLRPSDRTVPVPAGLVGDARAYALRVVGSGFHDDLLRDGDLIIVEDDPAPPEGSVVLVVLPPGERSALRIYHLDGPRIRFTSTVGAHDMVVEPMAAHIRGRVLGSLRQYP